MRLVDPEVVARHGRVETNVGVIPVQPLHEIETIDAYAARVLDVSRSDTACADDSAV